MIVVPHAITGEPLKLRIGDCIQTDALEDTLNSLARIHGNAFDLAAARRSVSTVVLCNACGLKDMYHSNRARSTLLAIVETEPV